MVRMCILYGCWSGKRACVGYADGAVKLLDLKTGSSIFTLAAGKLGHSAEVTCLDCHISDSVIITGSTDCTALLINASTGKVSVYLKLKKTKSCFEAQSRGYFGF